MELPAFQYHRPTSAEDAVALLRQFGDDADVIAGGTDLLPNYKNRLNNKSHVVSLSAIGALRELSATRIGALTRIVDLERSELLAAVLPVVCETAASISSPPLREHGTVGGNLMLDTRCYFFNQAPMWRRSKDFCLKAEGQQCLVVPSSNDHCYATYCGELAAAFLVLGASIELLGPDGKRSLPLSEFFEDEGIVRFKDRRADEIVVGVTIPESAQQLSAGYSKLRIRDSIDFPSLGVAVALRIGGGRIERLHVATTAMTSRPECLDEVVETFVGQDASPDLAHRIGEAVRQASQAYRNVPLDPNYRRKMASVFARRLLGRLDPAFAD